MNSELSQPDESIALRELHSLFNSAIEATGDMFYDWNADTNTVFMAGQVKKYLGVEPESIRSLEDWIQFIHPDDVDRFNNEIQQLVWNKANANLDYRIIGRNKRVIHVQDRGQFTLNDAGELIRMVGFVSDITEKKQKESILLASQRGEMVSRMMANIAHDLSNMTQAIMTASQAAQHLCDSSEARNLLQGIENAASQAGDLVRRLNQVSRQAPERIDSVSLTDVISTWLDIFRPLLASNVQLETDLDPQIALIQADSIQIEQMVANLCINAKDAMPDGGTVKITTRTAFSDELGEVVRLQIEDSGCGITDFEREKMFLPFFTTKNPERGTGLGLSIVKQIVDNHNAMISVRSEIRKGSTFTVDFPVLEKQSSKPDFASIIRKLSAIEILLVDDDPLIRRGIQTGLDRLGITISTVDSGIQAIHAVEQGHQFDLIIIDVIMPGQNGYQTYLDIRDKTPETKFLFISGFTNNVLPAELEPPANLSVLNKPFRIEAMLSRAAKILENPQA